MAYASLQLQDYENAIRYSREALTAGEARETTKESSLEKDLQQAYLYLLEAQQKLDRPLKALYTIQDFLQKFPESRYQDELRFQMARIYQDLRQWESALGLLQQLVETSPQSPFADDAQFESGRCYEALEEWKAAQRAYQQLCEQFPGSPLIPQAEDRIAYIQTFHIRDTEKTLSQMVALTAAMLLDKAQEESLYLLTKLTFENLKDYEKCLQLGQLILGKNLAPRFRPDLLLLIARSYERLAQKAEAPALLDSAYQSYRRFLREFPDRAEAPEVAIRLAILSAQKRPEGPERIQRTHEEFLKLYAPLAATSCFDQVLYHLAMSLVEGRDLFPSDSLENALRYFDRLREQFPESPWASEALFQKARLLARLGREREAHLAFRQYLDAYPKGKRVAEAHYRFATLSMTFGRFSEALQELETLTHRFPYSPYADSARIRIIEVALPAGKPERALALLQELLPTWAGLVRPGLARPGGESPDLQETLRFKQGEIYRAMGQLDQAREALLSYLRDFPLGTHRSEALFYLASIAESQGRKEEALEYYQRCLEGLETSRTMVELKKRMADLLFDLKRYEKARKLYEEILPEATDETEKAAIEARAIICLIRLGYLQTARTRIQAFRKRYKRNVSEHLAAFEYEKGEYHTAQKNFRLAEKAFKTVLSRYKKTPYFIKAQYGLGKVFLITNHIDKALKILTRIPKKYPDSEIIPNVYLTLGDFYYKSKQPENAMLAFKKVVESQAPEDIIRTAMGYLIKVYSDLGLWDSALLMSRQYIQRFPEAPDILDRKIQIGMLYMQLSEYDRAIEFFRSLLDEADRESEAEIQYWIGKCYFKMGQFEKAISEYMKVSYLARPTKLPWDITAEYESGLAYMKLKQWDKAKAIFRRIIQKEGAGSEYGKFALRKIREIESLEK